MYHSAVLSLPITAASSKHQITWGLGRQCRPKKNITLKGGSYEFI